MILPRAVPNPTYKDPNYVPGGFSMDPAKVNNRGFFALFALLGVAMILVSIWFFFWAKNGGCVFRKGDWEDYKSTVLRRKGPDGKTLSGATKSTRLGGGSVFVEGEDEKAGGEWRAGEQRDGKVKTKGKRGNRNNDDADMRAYRHEKPARVGGLNREMDGVLGGEYMASRYGDDSAPAPSYTDDSRSTISGSGPGGYVPINTPRKSKQQHHRASNNPTTPNTKSNPRNSHMYATPGSNNSTDSHRPLRQPDSGASTPTRTPRQNRNSRSIPGSFYTEPADFESRYTASEAGTEDSRGTKAYFHPLPKLGGGGKQGGGGFRRGGGYGGGGLSDDEL